MEVKTNEQGGKLVPKQALNFVIEHKAELSLDYLYGMIDDIRKKYDPNNHTLSFQITIR